MAGSFFDTTILVSLASADPAKADRAEALLAGGGTISVQVLNEMANVARRKMGMGWPELRAFLALIRGLVDIVPLTSETHDLGLTLAARHQFAVYDATILAAALLAGCDTLWSEDMQDGRVVNGGLRIANPF